MIKKYTVYFQQMNAMSVEVEASSPKAAYNKAKREVRDEYQPHLEVVQHDVPRLKETLTYFAEDLGVES